MSTLFPYLSDHWCDYLRATRFPGPDANDYPPALATSGPEGAATDPAVVVRAVFSGARGPVEHAVLDCAFRVQSVHNGDLSVALARATNDWQVTEWLAADGRFRASLVVPSQYPQFAADEIDRLGGEPGFVQVVLPVRSAIPYGNRIYDPLYAAAVRHDLAIGIQYGGAPGNPPTPSGWPSTQVEEVAGMAQVAQSQLMSLVTEGTFDRFEGLRVALIECGVSWMPSFLWRFDKEWKGLRRTVPWMNDVPSNVIREHIRFSTAPIHAGPPEEMEKVVRWLGPEMLMFASDYPRHHGDDIQALLDVIPADARGAVMADNARDFYKLG